jgi:FlaA1/EpsC-like NDP-sugar epimerase
MRKANVIIIGAGSAGKDLCEDISNVQKPWNVVGFLDDVVRNADVLGSIGDLGTILSEKRIHKVFFAIPRMKTEKILQLKRTCHLHGVDFLIIPQDFEVTSSGIGARVSQLRELEITDMLGREFKRGDLFVHTEFYKNQTVLITGAAGSIGSELVKQLIGIGARKIICVDQSEIGMFELQQKYGRFTQIEIVVTDLKEKEDIEHIFKNNRPIHIVFHAAAYKHVPLMEKHPKVCIRNNIKAFQNLLEASEVHGVEQVVLVSSDKACTPINVMGATKRVCEMLMQNHSTNMRVNCVRFGNVLNSSGSVVQIFNRQIKQGWNLIVTHRDMKRYFMTIPEAVFLIIETGKFSKSEKTFLLNMGEMIRIADLAKKVIQIHGYLPDEEIKIEYTEPRPGEKLEENLYDGIGTFQPTDHEQILMLPDATFNVNLFNQQLSELMSNLGKMTDSEAKQKLFEITDSLDTI